jgi:LCP family protein required for cell wall assembly
MNARISAGRTAVALALAIVMGSATLLGEPVPVQARAASGGLRGWLSVASSFAAPFRPLLDALAGSNAISYGSDGRLTVLLLGSDTRTGGIGRTDTIMVVSLKGNQISAASIPRDASHIPNYLTAQSSDQFKGRINTIARQVGLDNFTYVVEKLLNIEIDYYALVSFSGFDALVNVVDPVSVDISRPIKDRTYWDDSTSRGIYFPAATDYPVFSNSDAPACTGAWKAYKNPPAPTWCHRALVYVRSRHGGSDFQRARRQQNFVGATIGNITLDNLAELVGTANDQATAGDLMTNIPFNTSTLALFDALTNASIAHNVVFKPRKYAKHIAGTTAYKLKLVPIRAWTAANMS